MRLAPTSRTEVLPSTLAGLAWPSTTGRSTPVAPLPFRVVRAVEALVAKPKKPKTSRRSKEPEQQLFSPADIPEIAGCVGHRLMPDASHYAIAVALNSAFFHAPIIKYFKSRPSTAEMSSSYSSIAALAYELLRAFGYHSPASEVMNFSLAETRERQEGFEYERLLAEFVLSGMPPEVLSRNRQAATTALKTVPQLVAAVAHIAEWAETILPRDLPPRGRPPDLSTDFLFQTLASTFYATFGLAPPVGSDRYDEAQGSLRWLDKVFTLAHERVNERILLDYAGDDREQRLQEEPIVVLIRKAYQSAPATRANNLRDGWRAWLKLSDQEKWPVSIWWPSGFDGGPSVVPKWLR